MKAVLFRGASYPLPEDGNDKGEENVRDADVRQTEEVRADAEDEDVADVAEVRECCGGMMKNSLIMQMIAW